MKLPRIVPRPTSTTPTAATASTAPTASAPHGSPLARTARAVPLTALAAAGLLAASCLPALADPPTDDGASDPDPQVVDLNLSPLEIELLAEGSGISVEEQTERVQEQEAQNNLYAELHAQGLDFDGAYFDAENDLVLQAPAGSAEARAAIDVGLEVRSPEHGEDELARITEELTAQIPEGTGLVSIVPDVRRDAVVVTYSGEAAAVTTFAADYGDAVVVEQGEPVTSHATFTGGDKAVLTDSGGYCSAGFPARSISGVDYMIWAGHCLEGMDEIRSESGTLLATAYDTEFVSYDGQPDQDIGLAKLAPGVDLTSAVNDYGYEQRIDATRGTWTPPVGTDACKSGATSGITCGEVTGYGITVNYTDAQGREQARVSGLASSSICTAPGDSGGAYVAGGYAIGMTSGGPAGQSCGFDQGYVEGTSSFFQPVEDALDEYGLVYAG